MSLLKTLKLDAIGKYAKSMSALQLGALTATVGALAVGGYFLSPYLRIGNAITKGWLISWFCGTPEERLLRHVLSNAEKGNPSSVLATIDAWCWSKQWMMNVGDVKGVIVDEQVAKSKPMVSLELGGYCGYSAVRIGRNLPKGAVFYTSEINPRFAAIATQIIKFAGLEDTCKILVGPSGDTLRHFATLTGHKSVDFLFIDHAKQLYLQDIKTAQEVGLLKPGTYIVADNVIFPGAPDYLDHVTTDPKFQTHIVKTTLEYSKAEDGVAVSIYQ